MTKMTLKIAKHIVASKTVLCNEVSFDILESFV